VRLENAFDQFYEEIALGAVPEGRISSAWERLRDFLVDQCGADSEEVFLQGSYSNQTAIKPVDEHGEYDLDVCAIVAQSGMTADDAFASLESILKDDKDYAKRLETDKRPCVRLRYADDDTGRFHVDIVAARPHALAHLEIPLRGDAWKQTAPRAYTQWCLSRGEQFTRTVRMLKRWRDVNEDEWRGVKSIVLQVLTSQEISNVEDDATALQQTLVGIQRFLQPHVDTAPDVVNPVLETEVLTVSWPDAHYRIFRQHIDEAADLSTRALNSSDVDESHVLWRELLGDDFPPPPTDPAERSRVAPTTPAPGYERDQQRAPRRERYGEHSVT